MACARGEIFEIASAGCGSDAIEPAAYEATTEEERQHAHELEKLREELQGEAVGRVRSRRDLSLSRQATSASSEPKRYTMIYIMRSI